MILAALIIWEKCVQQLSRVWRVWGICRVGVGWEIVVQEVIWGESLLLKIN